MELDALTQLAAARLLGVAPKTLREWHEAPRNDDGTYDGPALVAWRIARLTRTDGFPNQRERLAAAQAQKYEMENAVRLGELCVTEEAADMMELSNSIIRDRLLQLPHALAPVLAAERKVTGVYALLEKWIFEALEELSTGEAFMAKVAARKFSQPQTDEVPT